MSSQPSALPCVGFVRAHFTKRLFAILLSIFPLQFPLPFDPQQRFEKILGDWQNFVVYKYFFDNVRITPDMRKGAEGRRLVERNWNKPTNGHFFSRR